MRGDLDLKFVIFGKKPVWGALGQPKNTIPYYRPLSFFSLFFLQKWAFYHPPPPLSQSLFWLFCLFRTLVSGVPKTDNPVIFCVLFVMFFQVAIGSEIWSQKIFTRRNFWAGRRNILQKVARSYKRLSKKTRRSRSVYSFIGKIKNRKESFWHTQGLKTDK